MDLHDSKEARSSLEAPAEAFDALSKTLDQGFCLAEIIPGEPADYRFIHVNHLFSEFTGIPEREAVAGKSARELVPGLEDFWPETYARVARTGKAESFSAGSEAMGREFQVNAFRVGGDGSHIVGILFTDTTERHRQEREHRRQVNELNADRLRLHRKSERLRRLYETVLSNTPDLVYVFDLDHRFTYANDALLRMWGKSWDEAIGKNCLELGYEPWHAEMHDREIEQVVATKAPIRGVVPFSGTNGRRMYDYIFVPVIGEGGLVEAVAGTTRDITDRIEAEEALRTSETRYRTLFETMDQGFCIMQMILDDSERIVDVLYLEVNPAFEQHTDIRNALGRKGSEIYGHIEHAWLERYEEVLKTGQAARYEHFSHPLQRWFDIYATPLGPREEAKLAVLFSDITQRKRQEANLAFLAEVAEEYANLSLEADILRAVGAKLGRFLSVASCNFGEVLEDGHTLSITHSWSSEEAPDLVRTYRTREYISDEFLQASLNGRATIVADTQSDPRADARRYAEIGIGSFVTVPHHRNGKWQALLVVTDSKPREWREDEVDLIRALADGIFPRLERARAEVALRESELSFRLVTESIPQIVWITDNEGKVLFFSRQWEEYTGVAVGDTTAAEVAARFVHPDDAEATMEAFQTARATGTVLRVEHRIRSRCGEYRWFLVQAQPFRDFTTGQITRWFGSSTDITEQKAAAQTLQEANEALERRVEERTRAIVAKNEELEGFSYSVSHDLRAPLRAIVANARIVVEEEGPSLSEEGKENLDRLSVAALRMSELIDDLLDYARLGRTDLRRERIDLAGLAKEVGEQVAAAHPHCTLNLSIGCQAKVSCDPRLISLALHNLIDNACKYRKSGETADVEFGCHEADGERVFFVRDQGIGFDMAYAPKLFQPFERLHRDEYAGTGIGLANVKRAIERHGGRVWAESSPGRGATFYFTL